MLGIKTELGHAVIQDLWAKDAARARCTGIKCGEKPRPSPRFNGNAEQVVDGYQISQFREGC